HADASARRRRLLDRALGRHGRRAGVHHLVHDPGPDPVPRAAAPHRQRSAGRGQGLIPHLRRESQTVTGSLRALPTVSDRVRDLHARMTLDEKLAQIVGYWLDHGGGVVAPMAGEMNNARSGKLSETTEPGRGPYPRVYGTRPVEPAERAAWLWEEQRRLIADTRLGIPALVHEE